MIHLSRLNGSTVAINPDLITWIDVTPDTTVSLLGGDKINVRESLEEVISRIISFRQTVGVLTHNTSQEVLERLEQLRESGTSRQSRPSNRPAPLHRAPSNSGPPRSGAPRSLPPRNTLPPSSGRK